MSSRALLVRLYIATNLAGGTSISASYPFGSAGHFCSRQTFDHHKINQRLVEVFPVLSHAQIGQLNQIVYSTKLHGGKQPVPALHLGNTILLSPSGRHEGPAARHVHGGNRCWPQSSGTI